MQAFGQCPVVHSDKQHINEQQADLIVMDAWFCLKTVCNWEIQYIHIHVYNYFQHIKETSYPGGFKLPFILLISNIGQHVVSLYLCDNIGFCENKDVVVVLWLTAFNCLLWVKFFLNLCMFLFFSAYFFINIIAAFKSCGG
jgi:hypothetical protein